MTRWPLPTHPCSRINARRSPRPEARAARQGLAQAGAVAAAVLHARLALYDVAAVALGGRPPAPVLLGGLVLAAAAGCAPIVAVQFPAAPGARRALALAASAGALLLLLRPPLPDQARPWHGTYPNALVFRQLLRPSTQNESFS